MEKKMKFIVADYYVQEGDEFMKTDSCLELHTEKPFGTKEEAKAWILDQKRQVLEDRELSEDDSGIEIVEENDGMLVMTYKVKDYGLELWHWQVFEVSI